MENRLEWLNHLFPQHFIMKNSRLHLVLLGLFGLSALTINAAQLASAKVLSVRGTVSTYASGQVGEAPNGSNGPSKWNNACAPLKIGDILTQDHSIVTSPLSNAGLVFSNGSELTVTENTSITLAELKQEAFGGKKSYEQLKADPSKSQALLELNYGKISGHVKQLRPGSVFYIETPLGTAAIRGTKFSVEIRYSAERGEYILIVTNKDGKVDIISRYSGSIEYGRGNIGDKGYDTAVSDDTSEAIPQKHTVVIRLSDQDPHYDDIINALTNYPPFKNEGKQPQINVAPPGPEVTPEDQSTTIASPNLPG
jgi:hypothetical protein